MMPALVAVVALASSSGVPPSGEPGPEDRLRSLRGEIQALEEKAAKAGEREKSVMAEVQRLDRLAALHREELALLTARTKDVVRKVETSDERMETLRRDLASRKAGLVRRLEEVRRVGSVGYLGAVLARPRGEGFLTALRQLSYLAARDRRRIGELRARTEDLDRIREDLARTDRELGRLRADTRRAEKMHREALADKSRLLESLRAEKAQALELKTEMEEAARSLQEMVGGLSAVPGIIPHVPLRLYQGELSWPVEGKVTQEFGRVESTRFDIPYPGMDIWAPLDAPVKAVAAGTVVYADWFQGYGRTLCLDHGDGYITVYAHLSDILVRPGKAVARDQLVARVGDTGSLKGPHLYFQLTKDGKPLDPRKWLKP